MFRHFGRYCGAVCLIILCICTHVKAQHSNTSKSIYSLQQALADIVKQHPLLKTKAFEIQAQNYALRAARSLLAPQFTATFDQNNDLVTITDPIAMNTEREIETEQQKIELLLMQPLRWGTKLNLRLAQNLTQTNNPFRNCVPGISSEQCYETRVSLSLTQPLLKGMGSAVNLAEEQWNEKAKALIWQQSRTQINQLILESIRTYTNVSLLQAQLALELHELKVIDQQIKNANHQVDLGVLPPSDLYPLESAHAQRMQSILQVKRNLQRTHIALHALTQAFNNSSVVLPTLANNTTTHSQKTPNWKKHTTLQAIQTRIEQARIRLIQAEDQDRSQFDVTLLWSQSGLGESITEALDTLPQNKSYFYGVNLTFARPLSDRNDMLVQQNQSQIKALQVEYQQQLQQLQSEWAQVQTAHPSLKKQLQWAEQAVQSTLKSWQSSQVKIEAGRGTQFEALEIQNRHLQAKFNVLSLTHDLFLNRIEAMSIEDSLLETFGIEINPQAMQKVKRLWLEQRVH